MLCRKCSRRMAAVSRGLSVCTVCAGLAPTPQLRPWDLLGVARPVERDPAKPARAAEEAE